MQSRAGPVNLRPGAGGVTKAVGMQNRVNRKRRDPQGRPAAAPGSVPHGLQLIYGWHSALAVLQNPRRKIRRVLATPAALERLVEAGISNLPAPVENRDIDRITGPGAVHQGLALLCDPLPETDIADLEDAGLVVVLDQVTDPHNVGAIIRSAAAFGCAALVLTERHGPADSGVLAKTASGGLEHVALVRVKNLARALIQLGNLGFVRLGLDSEHALPLEAEVNDGRVALVLGAEGRGLRRLTREHCDRLVRLDVPGPIKSLNVSNAAALALYALTRPPRSPITAEKNLSGRGATHPNRSGSDPCAG
jgi:23S rRNA (guanosine2251-2'-O)-methyltransferase